MSRDGLIPLVVFPLTTFGQLCVYREGEGLSLWWDQEGTEVPVSPHVFPLALIEGLGPSYAAFTVWMAQEGVSVASDVLRDVQWQAQRARRLDMEENWR